MNNWRQSLLTPRVNLETSEDVTEKFYKKLLIIAQSIGHCGDYGYLYWNPDSKTVWWVMADSDEEISKGYDTREMIKEKFLSIDGVKEVIIEAEASPKEDTWIEISPEIVPLLEENTYSSWRGVLAWQTRVRPKPEKDRVKEKRYRERAIPKKMNVNSSRVWLLRCLDSLGPVRLITIWETYIREFKGGNPEDYKPYFSGDNSFSGPPAYQSVSSQLTTLTTTGWVARDNNKLWDITDKGIEALITMEEKGYLSRDD